MLLKGLGLLKQHRFINLILIAVYGLSLIFLHDFFVQLSVNIMNSISLEVYNNLVFIISISCAVVLLAYLFYKMKIISHFTFKSLGKLAALKLFFLLITSALLTLHYKFMFEMNIEVIHVVEFAVLGVLIFPVFGRFGAAVIFTLPFIFVNEWYQYVVLYPTYIHYFEFNDIIIDLLGCGMAMIFLWISGVNTSEKKIRFFLKPEIISLVVINLSFVILIASCVFAFYPAGKCGNTILVLNQLPNPRLFWQTHVFGAVYHVMKPIEGIIAINLVCLFFTFTDYAARNK